MSPQESDRGLDERVAAVWRGHHGREPVDDEKLSSFLQFYQPLSVAMTSNPYLIIGEKIFIIIYALSRHINAPQRLP